MEMEQTTRKFSFSEKKKEIQRGVGLLKTDKILKDQ